MAALSRLPAAKLGPLLRQSRGSSLPPVSSVGAKHSAASVIPNAAAMSFVRKLIGCAARYRARSSIRLCGKTAGSGRPHCLQMAVILVVSTFEVSIAATRSALQAGAVWIYQVALAPIGVR